MADLKGKIVTPSIKTDITVGGTVEVPLEWVVISTTQPAPDSPAIIWVNPEDTTFAQYIKVDGVWRGVPGFTGPEGPQGEPGPEGPKGEDGQQGEDGKSGVVISESEPTDPDTTVWVNPAGAPFTDFVTPEQLQTAIKDFATEGEVGDLTELKTEDKSNLVGAVNEVSDSLVDLEPLHKRIVNPTPKDLNEIIEEGTYTIGSLGEYQNQPKDVGSYGNLKVSIGGAYITQEWIPSNNNCGGAWRNYTIQNKTWSEWHYVATMDKVAPVKYFSGIDTNQEIEIELGFTYGLLNVYGWYSDGRAYSQLYLISRNPRNTNIITSMIGQGSELDNTTNLVTSNYSPQKVKVTSGSNFNVNGVYAMSFKA